MALLTIGVFWEIASGFSKKLLTKDMNRIIQSGFRVNRSWFHRLEKLLNIPIFFSIYIIQMESVWFLRGTIYPNPMSLYQWIWKLVTSPPDNHSTLIAFLINSPPLFSSIALSMVLFNLVEWYVPFLRRLSEANTGFTFLEVMSPMIALTLLIVPVCLFFQLLGALV